MNTTPILLWLSCFSSKARIRTRTSACISTVPAAQFALEWPFMTHCSLLNRKSPHYVWGLPPAWGLFCWRLARLNQLLAQHTGQTVERISSDTDRDKFMSAEDAKAYGLIDQILSKRT